MSPRLFFKNIGVIFYYLDVLFDLVCSYKIECISKRDLNLLLC